VSSVSVQSRHLRRWAVTPTVLRREPLPPREAFDSELSLIEEEMVGAVKAMPADQFGFARSFANFLPARKTEFDKVRTFAQ
jgi:hypothetical protein